MWKAERPREEQGDGSRLGDRSYKETAPLLARNAGAKGRSRNYNPYNFGKLEVASTNIALFCSSSQEYLAQPVFKFKNVLVLRNTEDSVTGQYP